MPRTISMALATTFLFLGHVHGHMIMNTPVPYNLNIQPLLQVDPISGGQYPFPCHNHYSFTSRTLVEAGSATLVNFTGAAQHGGGSCQFSISYDEPTGGGSWNKSVKFKTIYTIIGGCPAVFTDEQHNLPIVGLDPNRREDGKHCGDDVGVDCTRQFMIPIPKLWVFTSHSNDCFADRAVASRTDPPPLPGRGSTSLGIRRCTCRPHAPRDLSSSYTDCNVVQELRPSQHHRRHR